MPMSTPEAQRTYQREWVRDRRKAFFKDKVCTNCPSTENLELHHEDPTQKKSHSIFSWSKVRFEKELAKCVILCKECHLEETKKQLRVEWAHGTPYGYRTHGCRCNECKNAHKIYMRNYKKKKKQKLRV